MRSPKRGLCLVELLIGLSLGAALLAAVATAVYGMCLSVRVNQAQLRAVRLGQSTIGYLTTQLRRSDGIDAASLVVDTSAAAASATSVPVTQFSIVFDGSKGRSDCRPTDFLVLTVRKNTQGGVTSVQVAKNGVWNGTTFSGNSWSTLPAIVASRFDCQLANPTADPGEWRVVGVTVNLTAQAVEQGHTIAVPLTGVAQICRVVL